MRTHQLVLHWIEGQLSEGKLAVGGRLPAERTLAEQLGVSRTSVREAIRILEAMGVVRAGVGSGPEAGTVVISDPTAALGSALRLHVATQHLPVSDIVETRVLLESWAAAHIRPDAPELAGAAALLDQMDAVGTHGPRTGAPGTYGPGTESSGADVPGAGSLTVDDFLALDVRFHLALADAAGNAVVSAMMGSLRESIQGYAAQLTANLPDWDATASRLRAEHRGILAAIRDDDGERAAKLVAAHIQGYYREAGVRQG
jgi:GntR family transcriptional repressor for pyruvate dehydrogenase complex